MEAVRSSQFGAVLATSNGSSMASGIDQQRLSLLLAVLEKRAGLNLAGDDVFVNLAGGMTIDEPASDLGNAFAGSPLEAGLARKIVPLPKTRFELGPVRAFTRRVIKLTR